MRTLLLFVLLFSFSSCVHVERTSSKPIRGSLHTEGGKPIPRAYIWATYKLPGGLFAAPKFAACGPAVTDKNGNFVLPLQSIAMIQTGTIWDGSTSPCLLVCHRDFGAYCTFSLRGEKELSYMDLEWSKEDLTQKERDDAIATMLWEFPAKDRQKAWKLIHQ